MAKLGSGPVLALLGSTDGTRTLPGGKILFTQILGHKGDDALNGEILVRIQTYLMWHLTNVMPLRGPCASLQQMTPRNQSGFAAMRHKAPGVALHL